MSCDVVGYGERTRLVGDTRMLWTRKIVGCMSYLWYPEKEKSKS